jgi:hypothetical protein
MDRFDRNDERLAAFTRALWDALVPPSGECVSVQGELVRANGRLQNEHFRNGMCNYYSPDAPGHGLADGYYPKLLVFIAKTIAANPNDANDDETVGWFTDLPTLAQSDWDKQMRIEAIAQRAEDEDREPTPSENDEMDALDDSEDRVAWEEVFERAELAIANYCRANPVLVDHAGKPIEERGVRDLRHVIDPPPPPPPCPLCNGKGWVAAKDPTEFPTMCSCKASTVLH